MGALKEKSRLKYIDGLRGVAITIVVFYHAYIRWTDLYPYKQLFVSDYFTKLGISGVYLFFIVSGYVILMSLEKTRDFWTFIYLRWKRLFPAMLACSIFLFITAFVFKERPRGDVNIYDLLPGITLLGDGFWRLITFASDAHPTSIEGAFWSLYVEVVFYIIFGFLYFSVGKIKSIVALSLLFMSVKFYRFIEIKGHGIQSISSFLNQSYFDVYIWFIAGTLYYLYEKEKNVKIYYGALCTTLIATLFSFQHNLVPCLIISVIFAATIRFDCVKKLISNRIFLFLGFVSYPLYLIHENMMVSLIVKIGRQFPTIPYITMPIIPITIVIFIAYIFARYIEPETKRFVVNSLNSTKKLKLRYVGIG